MTHFTDRLSDYLDDDLPVAERAEVEAHLAACAACAADLAALRAIAAGAAALSKERPMANDAWPAIEARLEPRGGARVRPWRVMLTLPQLAAAAVLLVGIGMAGMWLQMRTAVDVPAQPDPATRTAAAVPAALGDASYADVVAELEAALAEGRDRLDPETVAVLETNLAAIDGAIAQAREALAADPANAGLTRHLLRTRAMRVALLRRAVAAAEGAS